MKICPQCQKMNPDESLSCLCGYSFEQNGEKVKRKKQKSSVRKDAIDYIFYILCFVLPLITGCIFGRGLISVLSISLFPVLLKRRNGYAGILAWMLSLLGFFAGILIFIVFFKQYSVQSVSWL